MAESSTISSLQSMHHGIESNCVANAKSVAECSLAWRARDGDVVMVMMVMMPAANAGLQPPTTTRSKNLLHGRI